MEDHELNRLLNRLIEGKIGKEDFARVQQLLRRNHIRYELRTAADEELVFEAQVPAGKKVDGVTEAIHAIDDATVEWDEKKELKPK